MDPCGTSRQAKRGVPDPTRVFDVIFAAAMLVVALPVMAVVALAILAESGRPVLYRQTRTGLGGKPFQMLKFRSMRCDAEADGHPRWAAKDDPRITRVGRFIRRTHLDESPQLFNVLCGDMSPVGPRPERPHFVDQLSREIPGYSVRHTVKPGITGWAQVRFRYGASVEEATRKLDFDLYYVRHRSLWLDLRILVETVRVVLTADGAR